MPLGHWLTKPIYIYIERERGAGGWPDGSIESNWDHECEPRYCHAASTNEQTFEMELIYNITPTNDISQELSNICYYICY